MIMESYEFVNINNCFLQKKQIYFIYLQGNSDFCLKMSAYMLDFKIFVAYFL